MSLLLLFNSTTSVTGPALVVDPVRVRTPGRVIVLTPRADPVAAGVQYPVFPLVSAAGHVPSPGRAIVVQQQTDTPIAVGTAPTAPVFVADLSRTRYPAGVVRVVAPAADPPVVDVPPTPTLVSATGRPPATGRTIVPTAGTADATPNVPIVADAPHPPPGGRSIVVAAYADPPPPTGDTPTPPIVIATPRYPTPGYTGITRPLTDTPPAVGDTPTDPVVFAGDRPRPGGVCIVAVGRADVAVGAPDSPTGALVITGRPGPAGKAGTAYTTQGFAEAPGISPTIPVVVLARPRYGDGRGRTPILGGAFGDPPPPQVTPTPTAVRVTHPTPAGGRVLVVRAWVDALPPLLPPGGTLTATDRTTPTLSATDRITGALAGVGRVTAGLTVDARTLPDMTTTDRGTPTLTKGG